MSIDEFARITPVRPPIVNKKMNPIVHRVDVFGENLEPCNVASHLKILIPVGIAIIIVAAVK